MNRAEAIPVIRKLLERYRAEPMKPEGQTALRKALELMQRHRLSDADLEVKPPPSPPARKPARRGEQGATTPIEIELKIGRWRISGRL